jgi:putative phage-type endonuclease
MTGILVPTVSEEAWLEARRQGITASEIAVVLGLSPYSSPFELYYRKRGDLPGQPDNDAMAIGRAMENFVADQFGCRHPEFYLTGSGRELYRHPDRDWQMATPDRCLWESPNRSGHPVAVLECKVDNGDGFGDEGTDEIPVHYRCQVLWQMDVLGVTTGYLAALIWHRRQVRVYELTMDDQARADLEVMRGLARAFLECVRMGVAPEPDWRPATASALKHLHPEITDVDVPVSRQMVISYQAAQRHYKAAEQRKDEMVNRMLDAIGDGHRAVDSRTGQVIASRQVYPVKEAVRKGYTVRKLVPARAPKESTE